MQPVDTASWLVHRPTASASAPALYFFAHAGGSAGEYARWSAALPGFNVYAVALPGRGSRLGEASITRMSTLVDAIVDAVDFAPPFALFGHSLGGLVAFEVARALTERSVGPAHLFVSSCPAPAARSAPTRLHELPDDRFLAEVERRWGRLAVPVRDNEALLALALSYFRADVELFETYRYTPSAPLICPITAIRGTAERLEIDTSAWSRHTLGRAEQHELPGGHFYLRDQRDALAGLIRAAYADSLHGTPPQPKPLYARPLYPEPLHTTPLHNTPLHTTPVSAGRTNERTAP